jgi:hypothetical protein
VRVVTDLFDERNNPLFERLGPFENAAAGAGGDRAPRAAAIAGATAAARARDARHSSNSHDRFAAADRRTGRGRPQ